jgi:hypothetical protein
MLQSPIPVSEYSAVSRSLFCSACQWIQSQLAKFKVHSSMCSSGESNLHSHSHENFKSEWSSVIVEKLVKISIVYGTWHFINIFTRTHHWVFFRARWILSIQLCLVHFNIIIHYMPWLQICLLLHIIWQKFLCAFFTSPIL